MFYLISKTFTLFLNPITWIVILLLIAYKTRKRIFLLFALLALLVFTNGPLCNKVITSTTQEYSNEHFDAHKKYKVALVMGGFSEIDRTNGVLNYTEASGRLWESVRLYKRGQVEKILITGDNCCRDTVLFFNYMRELGVPGSAFIIEPRALNTRQNVVYTMPLIKGRYKDKEMLLITSALHMKRSLACFAREGVYPDFYSVDTHQGIRYTARDFYPNWHIACIWQAVFNEWIGMVVYRIAGYA